MARPELWRDKSGIPDAELTSLPPIFNLFFTRFLLCCGGSGGG